jgi:membrane protease YdiL (CAAX protease family)
MPFRRSLRVVLALVLAAVVALAARYSARVVTVPDSSFIPQSFVTHTVMLLLSIAAMLVISKGRLDLYGLTAAKYQFTPRILLWAMPTAVLTIASIAMSPQARASAGSTELTRLQLVVFVWIYASIGEEVLTRGLLQTLLSGKEGSRVSPRRRLSMPVVVSALFFGAMHIFLFESMGAEAVPVILLVIFLGFVAARYRESTGSLLPAVIVHALFNIGGMLPLWIVQWLQA